MKLRDASRSREPRDTVQIVTDDRPLGRIPRDGRIVSSRLNPEVAFIQDDSVVPDDVTPDDLAQMFGELGLAGGGKRRQQGGAMTYTEQLKYAKAVAMMVLYNSAWGVQEGGIAAKPYVLQYLKTRLIDPLYPTGGASVKILLGLADQILQSGVTVVNLSVSSSAYTANVVSKIIQKFNEWGTATSVTLVSDAYAQAAADAAVESGKQIGVTAAVAGFVANQIGLLPMSAVLAAILFSMKINLGTGTGRAYLVASFYTWFLQQKKADQTAILDAAKEYAATAGSGASDAAKKSAAKLGPLLAKAAAGAAAAGAGAAGNAFAAVAAAVRGKPGGVVATAAPANDAPAVVALLEAAVHSAAEAMAAPSVVMAAAEVAEASPAVAAGDAPLAAVASAAPKVKAKRLKGTAAPFTPGAAVEPPPAATAASGAAGDGSAMVDVPGGRRKTKKTKSKRRVTRRRKAQKILGTPVFIY